ncbi:MAG: Holliday junction resolvase RuvX [Candidatus Omnitrophota bacterium]
MRVLGFDIGTKRVGVAVSDELGMCANAKDVFTYTTKELLINKIKNYAEELFATEIVIGLPINMDGSLGASAKAIMEIVETVKKEVSIPVHTFDERFSTVIAEEFLIEADLSRKKRKKIIDAAAAQIILQDYLSMIKQKRDTGI